MTVKHTSSETEGQIYIPEVNWALAASCIALVLAFRESSKLAAAYGIAVTGTMAITSVVFYVVMRRSWGWPVWKALPLLLLFLAWDLPFFASNALKLLEGGWVPIVVGVGLFAMMIVWKRGRAFLAESFRKRSRPVSELLARLDTTARVPGAAVFLTSSADDTPPVLDHHLRHNKVLHETVVLLTVRTGHVPRVDSAAGFELADLGKGLYRLVAHVGFMQTPDVPALLRAAAEQHGVSLDLDETTYYLGRETFLATSAGRMGVASESLFGFMSKNASAATGYFGLPPDRVVELGMQIDL